MARGGLPFSCSQCGGRERFGTLALLRTHIQHLHQTRDHHHHHHHAPDPLPPPDPSRGLWWQGNSLPSPSPGSQRRSDGGRSLHRRRRTQSVGVGTQDEEEEEEEEEEGGQVEEDAEEKDAGKKDEEGLSHMLFINHLPSPLPPRPPPDLGPDPGLDPGSSLELGGRDGRADYSRFAGLEAAVRGRLAILLRAADSSMQRRLARISWELAQTDTELLCEHAHRQHLARERHEAAERQRSLSRQVDVAVAVIAAMREQLNASENQLEQREREALSIQSFLESAVRQETSGRVRVQRFIETLLERIALAERLVQFYQEESAGGQPYSGFYDNRSPSSSSSSSSSRPTQDQDQEWVWEPRQRCRSLGYEV
ncbi:hypothetical protein NHX12_022215 [Muraenolepis orangiensis]|uniref:FBX41/ZN365 C2H2-type zinc finger domain-containing protein n=1 Tax=Muraenolepis orangiensis TaxID=630683 RepID=A0A9Q0IUY4_9TELE|nr:hypothetical protein NHX12_022215 [Muraenolepis orangiensis]